VLNSLFKPPTGEEELFEVKPKYMYAVFERVLQKADKGKALVESHRQWPMPNRSIMSYVKMLSDLLPIPPLILQDSCPTSLFVRNGDGNWNGTTHSFIFHWQEFMNPLLTRQPSSALSK